ncbi:membrane protein insertase YidC [Telmatospirillum sp.]|uniref:membrane protein insertase YidC n=1 Tax=Telmatospirillum sp. TaxID=2079197 RepID=UPI002850C698|nr:membrane protein insertase YidC [Telmatospirillum sp.]MDR3439206.1 membrane protein insertase YidC [Telmatospirillum sp.]
MNEQRNIILAIVLSVAILLGWQFLMPKPPVPVGQTPAGQTAGQTTSPQLPDSQASSAPTAPEPPKSASAPAISPEKRAAALAAAPRVKIVTPSLKGSFSLLGARIDDLDLVAFHETPDPSSPAITLLSPATGIGAYYAEFGFVAGEAKEAVPGADTLWTASADTLTPEQPVTLTWDNGQGLKFTRVYAVDANYMFTVTQKVENTSATAATLFPYALVSRWGTPQTQDIYILHEGALGVLDGTLKEAKYKKLREDDHLLETKSTGGWIGVTDKYWLTALVPDQSMAIQARMGWRAVDGVDRYQTDWLGSAITIAPGAASETSSHFFAGAKELAKLDAYGDKLGIPRFDLAIDFGWFYFLTKPFFYFLRFIHSQVANFGIAILIFTVVIKGAFFPIANKSYKAMSKMKKLQPEIKKLQERFGDDRARLNQEMMALYKREKANPVSGCLPIVIQIPVFFALYKVLYVTIEMRQAPFFGWIHDLSVPDPTTLFNLFGAIPWDPPQMLHIGIWPLIMGVTMFLQQKLNPAPADPIQAKMFTFLPIIFTFMLANFPAGLVIYWAWSNTLSILQQWLIMKRQA